MYNEPKHRTYLQSKPSLYMTTNHKDAEKPVSSNKIVMQVTSIAILKYCGGEIYLHVRKKQQQTYLIVADDEAAAASAIKELGWRACRQAPMSNGCNSEPSNIRFTPGRITSLLSFSSGSVFNILVWGTSSTGLVEASYTGANAYDLHEPFNITVLSWETWDEFRITLPHATHSSPYLSKTTNN